MYVWLYVCVCLRFVSMCCGMHVCVRVACVCAHSHVYVFHLAVTPCVTLAIINQNNSHWLIQLQPVTLAPFLEQFWNCPRSQKWETSSWDLRELVLFFWFIKLTREFWVNLNLYALKPPHICELFVFCLFFFPEATWILVSGGGCPTVMVRGKKTTKHENEHETNGGTGRVVRTSPHILALATHTNEWSLLILDAEMFASCAVEYLECILVSVDYWSPRYLVRMRLEHAHLLSLHIYIQIYLNINVSTHVHICM